MKNVVLIGFMGVGKGSVAREVIKNSKYLVVFGKEDYIKLLDGLGGEAYREGDMLYVITSIDYVEFVLKRIYQRLHYKLEEGRIERNLDDKLNVLSEYIVFRL